LDNFYPAVVEYEGITYPTTEHAYAASKTLDRETREYIARLPYPHQAKAAGRQLKLRDDWEVAKFKVMEDVLRLKFAQEPFKSQLKATGDAHIEEGNTWDDTIWGVVDGEGENHLGKILMKIRAELA